MKYKPKKKAEVISLMSYKVELKVKTVNGTKVYFVFIKKGRNNIQKTLDLEWYDIHLFKVNYQKNKENCRYYSDFRNSHSLLVTSPRQKVTWKT